MGERVWHLLREDEILAVLTEDGENFPWLLARFAPRPGFAEVRHLFAPNGSGGGYDSGDGLLRLVAVGSGPAAEFWLVVDGDRAAFRWRDEPDDD